MKNIWSIIIAFVIVISVFSIINLELHALILFVSVLRNVFKKKLVEF